MPPFPITRRSLPLLAVSLAACAAIPEVPEGPTDPLERHAGLQAALDGTPLTSGNRVEVLDGGGAAFAAAFRAMASARQHIHLEYYILEDVHVPGLGGPSLFELLRQKLAQGVAVSIIHDAWGSNGVADAAWDGLRAAGARVVAFNPVDPTRARSGWRPNNRDHRKILVVDGRIGITGGINLDHVYENPCEVGAAASDPEAACWRDTALRLEGPAVATLQRLFLDTWTKQGGEALPDRGFFPALPASGAARVRILGSAPTEGRPRSYVAVLTAILGARQSIRLCTGYFVPTAQARGALRDAARRGVDVRLLLPSVSDAAIALAAQRGAYDDLLEAGVQIREEQGAVLHAKVMVVDGAWSMVGSSNLDRRSVAWNNEVDAVVLGRETAAGLTTVLDREWRRAKPVSLADWRARSLGDRLEEQASRLVIDLL